MFFSINGCLGRWQIATALKKKTNFKSINISSGERLIFSCNLLYTYLQAIRHHVHLVSFTIIMFRMCLKGWHMRVSVCLFVNSLWPGNTFMTSAFPQHIWAERLIKNINTLSYRGADVIRLRSVLNFIPSMPGRYPLPWRHYRLLHSPNPAAVELAVTGVWDIAFN